MGRVPSTVSNVWLSTFAGELDGYASADWDTEIDLSGEDLDCVLRVERFPSS